MCELAKQIGFAEDAKNLYALQSNLATYRHLVLFLDVCLIECLFKVYLNTIILQPPEVVRRDTKFARSLHLNTRVKVPLPHMLSVIIKDQGGGLQLMSQVM